MFSLRDLSRMLCHNTLDGLMRDKLFTIAVLAVLIGTPVSGRAEVDASSSTAVEISSQAPAPVSEPETPVSSAESAVIQAEPAAVLYGQTPVAAAPPAALAPPASYAPGRGGFNLNINYPGAALRYFAAEGKALELLGQRQDNVFVGGLRYYYYPARLRRGALNPYLAVEGDYISFKGTYSKGAGWGGGLYAGAEYFLSRRVSAQTDLGALYLSIEDKDTSLTESGTEFLVNLGVNIYFGKGGS
jgi:hypothetical protein